MLKISNVQKDSVGYEIGLEKGDVIESFNGYPAQDILDYVYFNSQEEFSITVKCKGGETSTVFIEKEYDETLGLTFEDDGLKIKRCQNKCIFCFIDQMPKEMRKSLYVKDDDYRQSFLTGNFITLTNLTKSDIDRIIRLNLSPLYVSVQTINGEKRKEMLGNKNADKIESQLKLLTSSGIEIETQVVLVRGVNDGCYLEETLKKLYAMRPNLQSVAIVPCGITKHREGLYPISDIDKGYANCVINQVNEFNLSIKENFGILADEFYIRAGQEIPTPDTYGNFSQVGNGVGMTAKFIMEIDKNLKNTSSNGKFLVVSGVSASEIIANQVEKILNKVKGITVKVKPIVNKFFGDTVTCTGLLTAKDILNGISSETDYDYLVIPDVCLKQDEDVFLDNITLQEFQNRVNKPVIITDGSGQSFIDAFTYGNRIRIIK